MSILSFVGVEDGSFKSFMPNESTFLCAVKMLGETIKVVRLGRVTVDGNDATDVLLNLIGNLECDTVILGGVSFAGFNIIDVKTINQSLNVPVIVFSKTKPDSFSILAALKTHFKDWETRWDMVKGLGGIYSTVTKKDQPPIFFEVIGASKDWACQVLKESASLSRIPEPVRVAKLIARGLTKTV